MNIFRSIFPGLKGVIKEYQLDYIIFGNHHFHTDEKFPYFGRNTHTLDMLELYEESAIEGMESGLFAYLGTSRPVHAFIS